MCIRDSLLLISLVCIIQYLKLGRTIDRRLAEGPFSASAEILTAPRTLSAGEPLAANDVVQSLQLSGYSRSRGNPAGWFDEQPGAIRIFPGANSVEGGTPVRLEFANGRISAIVSLADQKAREVYPLDPQPVSYTHLDVYKRQGERRAFRALLRRVQHSDSHV